LIENDDNTWNDDRLRGDYEWAIKIIRNHFASGLEAICDKHFLDQRYEEFQSKHDPIYGELLKGMGDEALAKTFVSYWTIGQTVATQSRFWLEDAIAEIIIFQVKHLDRPATHVYSQSMLGPYFQRRVPIAEIGEQVLEHLSDRSPWEVPVQQSALKAIDILIGEQERTPKPPREMFHLRQWSNEQNTQAISTDREQLDHIASSLKGPPATSTRIQCNLLVIEPDKLDGETHAWGIRFINPTTISKHPQRKQERVNLLRLYALLVQEKVMRQPASICVCLAELLPRRRQREDQDHYPDYFSALTYWSSDKLWRFIGVPFGVVSLAIRDEAKAFRKKLKEGLRTLLPHGKKEKPHGKKEKQRGLFDE
jgi:hypothetical protein